MNPIAGSIALTSRVPLTSTGFLYQSPASRTLAIPRGENLKAKVGARSPNGTVQAEDGQVCNSGAGGKRAGQVQGVEGADGLSGKWAAGPIQNVLVKLQQVPVSACPRKGSPPVRDLPFPEPFHHLSPDQHPVGLDKREDRGEYLLGIRQLASDLLSFNLTEQPGEDGARLSVEPHRVPRSASSSFADVVDRSRRDKGG